MTGGSIRERVCLCLRREIIVCFAMHSEDMAFVFWLDGDRVCVCIKCVVLLLCG